MLTKAGVETSPQNSNKNIFSAVVCAVIPHSLGLGRTTEDLNKKVMPVKWCCPPAAIRETVNRR